ncbi:hypothetical protein AMTRI_Chr08g210460 [Amborella trichopoda]
MTCTTHHLLPNLSKNRSWFSGDLKTTFSMTKVYPNAASEVPRPVTRGPVVTLTVWKKSLLFNCNGFTVYDSRGNLVFRVDNYLSDHKGELVLMDACGKSLLTLRRKVLSLSDHWLIFDGDFGPGAKPRFSMKKSRNFLNPKSLAHVFSSASKTPIYEIEGIYSQRCCTILDEKQQHVAEIKCKEASKAGISYGWDVFKLIVQPEMEMEVAMALVLLLDHMFSSRWSTAGRRTTDNR